MRISVRRAGAVGLLALAAVTALGGATTAAPSNAKSPSRAMAEAAHGPPGGSGKLTVVAAERHAYQSTEMWTWSSWRRVGLQLQGSEGWR